MRVAVTVQRLALALALVVAAVGCGSGGGPSADATPRPDVGGPGTWGEVYATVIASPCAPCHTEAGGVGITSGHLDMSNQSVAYANLVGVEASGASCSGLGTLVSPGAPASSILYLKVSLDDPTPCGSKMPQNKPSLPRAAVDDIAAWIQAGALDN